MSAPDRIVIPTAERRSKASREHADRYSPSISDNQLFTKTLRDPIAEELVNTHAFLRLRDISFLGAISYIRDLETATDFEKENRYFHSIGVAKIGEKFAIDQRLPDKDRRLIVAAALLHDIGHPPLSHSAESAFHSRFGENHHSMTERIIRGQEKFARDIPNILIKHKVDPEYVLSMLNGRVKVRGLDLFKGPFNLDTLEGISRCSAYMTGTVSQSIPSPELVLCAAVNVFEPFNVPILDCFWRMKNRVYGELIRNETGVAADHIANKYFNHFKGAIDRSIMLATDLDLLRQHEQLFRRLHDLAKRNGQLGERVEYMRREFVVNDDIDAIETRRRYTHREVPSLLI